MRFAVDGNPAIGLTLLIEGNEPPKNRTNRIMNKVKIAARYSNLTEAVAATGMDLSYNESHARQKIRWMETDRSLKLVSIFSDEMNQIWYIINSVSENLNLLHKFEPFFSCIHNRPVLSVMPINSRVWSQTSRALRASRMLEC